MPDRRDRAENGLRQVRRTLESEITSLKHRASEANGVAPEDSFSQHDRQGAPWLPSGGCAKVGRRELGYMSRVMTGGNRREVAGIRSG
jgi:hypothetical protein